MTTRTALETIPQPARPAARWVGALTVVCAGLTVGDPVIAVALGCVAALANHVASVDIASGAIPDRTTAATATVVVVAGVIESALPAVLAAGAIAALPIVLVHLLDPRLIGFGDVKLCCALGGGLGLVSPLLAAALLPVAAGTSLIAAVITRRRSLAFGGALAWGFTLSAAVGFVTLGYDA